MAVIIGMEIAVVTEIYKEILGFCENCILVGAIFEFGWMATSKTRATARAKAKCGGSSLRCAPVEMTALLGWDGYGTAEAVPFRKGFFLRTLCGD